MSADAKRARLVDSAAALFQRQGYGATGAREIATAAGLPQGSFTNHFRSKEALAGAALEAYRARLATTMADILEDDSRSPAERVLAYFDTIAARIADGEWRQGCLIPDLATEAPVLGDALRTQIAEVMASQTAAFARVLDELPAGSAARGEAAFIVAAWHGTLLRTKVERSARPIERFRHSLEALLSR